MDRRTSRPSTLPATAPPQRAAAVLVGVDLGAPHFDGELQELGLLAETAGMDPVARLTCRRKAPDAALFVGVFQQKFWHRRWVACLIQRHIDKISAVRVQHLTGQQIFCLHV